MADTQHIVPAQPGALCDQIGYHGIFFGILDRGQMPVGVEVDPPAQIPGIFPIVQVIGNVVLGALELTEGSLTADTPVPGGDPLQLRTVLVHNQNIIAHVRLAKHRPAQGVGAEVPSCRR